MYKIYGILGAEYPRPDYHRASVAKPLVGGQGRSPLKLKAIAYFGRPVNRSGNIMALGEARVPRTCHQR